LLDINPEATGLVVIAVAVPLTLILTVPSPCSPLGWRW
jgi:hypothetical protein